MAVTAESVKHRMILTRLEAADSFLSTSERMQQTTWNIPAEEIICVLSKHKN